MARYPLERREWVLRQMMPPLNRSVVELAEETGITPVTLYAWRKQARAAGVVMPGDGKSSEEWSRTDKFRVVLEVAGLSEVELAEYSRREPVQARRAARDQPDATAEEQGRVARVQDKAARQRIKSLEREVTRKNAALAEAAALLVLQKKVQALWDKDEDG